MRKRPITSSMIPPVSNSPVAENNPKFFNTKLREARKLAKSRTDFDPYKAVYSFLPDAAKANPDARQRYINGHFCYAVKAGIVTNGLGICRHIAFFDDDFRKRHPGFPLPSPIVPTRIRRNRGFRLPQAHPLRFQGRSPEHSFQDFPRRFFLRFLRHLLHAQERVLL